MERHPLDIEPLGSRLTPQARCGRRPVCQFEIAVSLVIVFLAIALAGPDRVAAGAGGVVGGLADMVRAIFDVGGFLRPSW